MKPEEQVRQYAKSELRKRGAEMRKLKWIGRKHAPDDVALLPRVHPLIEFKAPGKKPTDGQLREHVRLRRAGFEVWVIDSFEAVDFFIRSYYE